MEPPHIKLFAESVDLPQALFEFGIDIRGRPQLCIHVVRMPAAGVASRHINPKRGGVLTVHEAALVADWVAAHLRRGHVLGHGWAGIITHFATSSIGQCASSELWSWSVKRG